MFETSPCSILPIAAMLLLAVACAGAPDDAAEPAPEPATAGEAPAAAGPPVGTWNLAAIDGVPVADDANVTLTIEAGGRISGGSGCNRYTSAASFEGASMSIGPIAGTRMACPEPQMDLEIRYLRALEGVETYEAGDDALRLNGAEGDTRLEFRRADDEDAAA